MQRPNRMADFLTKRIDLPKTNRFESANLDALQCTCTCVLETTLPIQPWCRCHSLFSRITSTVVVFAAVTLWKWIWTRWAEQTWTSTCKCYTDADHSRFGGWKLHPMPVLQPCFSSWKITAGSYEDSYRYLLCTFVVFFWLKTDTLIHHIHILKFIQHCNSILSSFLTCTTNNNNSRHS